MDRNEVLSSVRACLVSRKGATPLSDLDQDFCAIIGNRIPFESLGYDSLEAFVRSEPSLVVKKGGEGVVVEAKVSEKSAHVSELVSKQKTGKMTNKRRFVPQKPYSQPPKKQPYRPSDQKPMPPNPLRVAPEETLRSSGRAWKGQYHNNLRGEGGRWRSEWRGDAGSGRNSRWGNTHRELSRPDQAWQQQIWREQIRQDLAHQELVGLVVQLYIHLLPNFLPFW